jgi:hypothetical protein
MKLVSRVNAIIYGKDNPERKPDPTVHAMHLEA